MRKIGLIAGGGTLPVRIIEACKAAGHQITTVALSNHADDVLPFADAVLRMGAAGDIISHFRAADVTELVMAGPVRRPSLSEIRPDAWGAKFLFRSGAGLLGDDGLLTAIAKALEKEGFQVIGAAASTFWRPWPPLMLVRRLSFRPGLCSVSRRLKGQTP